MAAPAINHTSLRLPIGRRARLWRQPVCTPARIARQLALAHQIRRRIDEGAWANQSEAAVDLGISRNRMSQVLMLTFLAPDIQFEVLALEAVDGVEPQITEKWLFENVARSLGWEEQRDAWALRSRGRDGATTSAAR